MTSDTKSSIPAGNRVGLSDLKYCSIGTSLCSEFCSKLYSTEVKAYFCSPCSRRSEFHVSKGDKVIILQITPKTRAVCLFPRRNDAITQNTTRRNKKLLPGFRGFAVLNMKNRLQFSRCDTVQFGTNLTPFHSRVLAPCSLQKMQSINFS